MLHNLVYIRLCNKANYIIGDVWRKMEYKFLEKVNNPADLKQLSLVQLKEYASELRMAITTSSIKCGGHLAPSLGAVELAIGLHYVLNSPKDKIVWDVGHQAYAHKIITGRLKGFKNLRSDEGISGFLKPSESVHDAFISGHASNSLSASAGLARASKLQRQDMTVAVVIGDGALTGGMAFEALNDIGATKENILVILNDNQMSISKNVGAMSGYFSRLRISSGYHKFKKRLRRIVGAVPFLGRGTLRVLDATKSALSAAVGTNKMFEQLGFRYYGPYDGNDLSEVIKVIKQTASISGPVLLHMHTQKGCGFKDAELDPGSYHGLMPVDEVKEHNFGGVAGDKLVALAKDNDKICAITAAMASGTGLVAFNSQHPDRFFDVGIAEQHAVTLAAGLAIGGLKPYCAIYSSFLQRSYDQIVHDIAILKLPVTLLVDRAGVIGADGITHQGTLDISYLNSIPNITILSPKDGHELAEMIEFGATFDAPLAIRYPKSYRKEYGFCAKIEAGKWEVFPFVKGFGGTEHQITDYNVQCANAGKKNTSDSCSQHPSFKKVILATGSRMLELATKVTGALIVNARSIKPLDTSFLDELAHGNANIITLEDGHLNGGFGQSVLSYINSNHPKFSGTIKTLGLKDEFVDTHSIGKAFVDNGLTLDNLQDIIDSL